MGKLSLNSKEDLKHDIFFSKLIEPDSNQGEEIKLQIFQVKPLL